ncbi:Folic acid synthesis protein fol1 [Astathelohania contejeani]|uniref:Folic acid synthesis protein fol1 n=1 Tax=Astathelohania contejeani TaxID=164912 RepID=A0ABQ7HYJ9_9MICR|nr:Folic acid synthesis protein fol1 [Thelohania contejeani]
MHKIKTIDIILNGPILYSDNDYKVLKELKLTSCISYDSHDLFLTDDINNSGVCYLKIYEMIKEYTINLKNPIYLTEYSRNIINILISSYGQIKNIKLEMCLYEIRPMISNFYYNIEYNGEIYNEKILISDFTIFTRIGCLETEKLQRRMLKLDLEFEYPPLPNRIYKYDFVLISFDIKSFCENGKFYNTLECLAYNIFNFINSKYCFNKIKVNVRKPNAVLGMGESGFEIYQATGNERSINSSYLENKNICYIMLGSNLGNRIENIHLSLKYLKEYKFIKIINSSFLYNTKYVGDYEDAPDVLNCMVKIRTELDPHELLKILKSIEKRMGRVKYKSNDNRIIDLDIIYYNNEIIKTEDLIIPHPRMHQREFVLRPLCDIDPYFIHPIYLISGVDLLRKVLIDANPLIQRYTDFNDLPFIDIKRIICIGNSVYDWNDTLIMGILNITPDSFSDGGVYFNNIQKAVDEAKEMINHGAKIIDIGGVSTRPGADDVDTEEELRRVVPVIDRIVKECPDIVLSIDTTNCVVLSECLKKGINIANYVAGLNYEAKYFEIIGEYNKPVILMHCKGIPKTMGAISKSYIHVIEEVADETSRLLEKVIDMGIYRWNIILDPGIGFAKDYLQNMALLNNFIKVEPFKYFPCLIGHSRKRFIEKLGIISKKGHKCEIGTISLTSILTFYNTFIIRVHNVEENALAVKMIKYLKNK